MSTNTRWPILVPASAVHGQALRAGLGATSVTSSLWDVDEGLVTP